jgi:hypothetical protein
VLLEADPWNFWLMFHWDGFSSANTSLKNCWTMDLSILNYGRINNRSYSYYVYSIKFKNKNKTI